MRYLRTDSCGVEARSDLGGARRLMLIECATNAVLDATFVGVVRIDEPALVRVLSGSAARRGKHAPVTSWPGDPAQGSSGGVSLFQGYV